MEYYKTSHLALIAALATLGISYISTEHENNRITFLYEDNALLHKAVDHFYNDGNLPVRTYSNNIKLFKEFIHGASKDKKGTGTVGKKD